MLLDILPFYPINNKTLLVLTKFQSELNVNIKLLLYLGVSSEGIPYSKISPKSTNASRCPISTACYK